MNYTKEFYQGCVEGNLQRVKEASQYRMDVSQVIETAFTEAANRGHVDILQYLLESYPNKINIHAEGERALIWACTNQHYSTVRFLLSKGADIGINNYEPVKELISNYYSFKEGSRHNIHDLSGYNEIMQEIFPTLKKAMIKDKALKIEMLTKACHLSDISLLSELVDNDFLGLPKEIKKLLIDNSFVRDNAQIIDIFKNDPLFTQNKEEILYNAIRHGSVKILNYFIHGEDLSYSEACDIFQKSSLIPAFNILAKYPFENYHILESYDNYNPMLMGGYDFFIPESRLPRYYKEVSFTNDKIAYAHLLLNRCMADAAVNVFYALVKDRKIYGIKDEQIIQYIVESNYELYQDDREDNNRVSNFEKMVDILLEEKVDLTSDVNGYLFQIAAYNKLDTVVEKLAEVSHIENFLNRYTNQNNWISNEQYELLNEDDCNNDRTYDIYKKFDQHNMVDGSVLETCEIMLSYQN